MSGVREAESRARSRANGGSGGDEPRSEPAERTRLWLWFLAIFGAMLAAIALRR